ncbi:Na(+)/H(+) antiporter NhaA [Cypionkella aquatica]|uniref:Putative Na(+)/H(+) antiporter NhaA homolog n=1 Tax=Cypionkella aquatica TaxID=1756042 RepID=A0AA37X1E1_9RHOB|nr:Na+/H+ antiporter NhaA [Cypionkella aquatica]GLS85148.1 Na(+)/H(+) antiporter NhaA [Cypionkella aquatica]GLS86720.1 Na(+)/H(+) antiporter NhaA [Cypionkella aquatica]
MYRVSPFVRHFALALCLGILAATLWLNLNAASYYDFIEWRLADLHAPGFLPEWLTRWGVQSPALTPASITSDGLMALFMFFVGKELWEALILERGALSGPQSIVPLGGVVGAAFGAAVVWIIAGTMIETAAEASVAIGWQVPLGSDVVLGYVIGRRVFGAGHPALHVLLLVTIACDVLGLLVLGLSYPSGGLFRLGWLVLPLIASFAVWALYGRRPSPKASEAARRRGLQLWPYILAGVISFVGIAAAGLPPALGLLPVLPAIPHADRSFGLFAEAENLLHDPLNRLAHLLVRPLALVLFLFGLTRGGIDFAAFAPTTLTTLAAFWIGKPLGFLVGCMLAARITRRTLPQGIRLRELLLIAALLGLGFTVPVLALETALPGGGMAEAARMGLALSLLAGAFALLLARLTRR